MTPKAKRRINGTITEYTVGGFGSSRDSDPEYLVDINPEHLGCSCKHDDYRLRPARRAATVTPENICKHIQLAMVQFYLDNIINKGNRKQ